MNEIILIIILIILGIAAISADIAIIYTIFRFRRLRSPFNIFLANWAISDLLSIIIIPICYLITQNISYSLYWNCISSLLALALHVTEILFGIVLSLDWCFAAYFQRISERFRKHYRYVIASIWILTLLLYIFAAGLCINNINDLLTLIFFIILYSICFIFVIVLQCSRIVQRCRTLPVSYPKPLTLRLTLITVIIFSYLLSVISMFMFVSAIFYHIVEYFFITVIVSIFAVLSSSVVTLILLCCLNYDFRQCLFQLRKPAHERFDNDTSENEDTVKMPPKISYHTSTQNIMTNGNQDLVS